MLGVIGWLTDSGAVWFSAPALVGTAYFLLSLVLGQLGGDTPGDVDVPVDADIDFGADGHADVGYDAGADVRAISLQTLSAFALGSGWMGLAAYRVADMSFAASAVVALLSGVAVAWVLLTSMRWLMRLQNSGNMSLGDTVGLVGDVRVSVPAMNTGRGRVSMVVHNRRREYSAVQHGDEPIATKTMVRVVSVDRSANTVVVEATEAMNSGDSSSAAASGGVS